MPPEQDPEPPSPPWSTSVRPPDLAPETVRDRPDPLAGWDLGIVSGPVVRDRRPFPTDTVVVAGGAACGLVVGAVAGRRPVRDGALGALVGAVAAAAVRRVWRSP